MKKEAREKQLKDAERSTPKRPMSAHAARSALTKPPAPPTAEQIEDEKKMAMRRAIVDKLREEVVEKYWLAGPHARRLWCILVCFVHRTKLTVYLWKCLRNFLWYLQVVNRLYYILISFLSVYLFSCC